ncbi:hypothetical protein [Phenylobacterium sp.]|uniref:hypothetical protein n=1 Tax=Phenylobacterium sp. TaxID=1871053 RepID=UPI002DEA9CB3|nr:hypothetical protein [Phenylobacterium sp.]
MNRLVLVLALAAAGLAGCATRSPLAPGAPRPAPQAATAPAVAPRVIRALTPKPMKCVPEDLGPPPAYPDSETALRDAGGAADRYQLLAAGRILREQRLQRLEDVVRRCRNAAR